VSVEIVSQDVGRHNLDIQKSASRILESGSWKPQNVIMLLPSARTIAAKVALSWMNLIFPPNNKAYRMLALGTEVGMAYSAMIEQILAHPDLSTWQYVLTVEHDNVPPPDGLLMLLESMERHPELACIGGLYWTKGEGGVPQIWGDPRDATLNFRPQVPIPGVVQECCGTGMGFNLFRLDMFKDKKLRRPWFATIANAGGINTQDLYFWGDARQNGYRCAVDCRVLVGHYDIETDITW
jgi:hypothetical protein